MSSWLYLIVGLVGGAGPAFLAAPPRRAWWARRWWQFSVGLAIVLFLLPVGIVLILFLISSAWDAIAELWQLLSDEFLGPVMIALGWLVGSAALAWLHRRAPYLDGPPLSDRVKTLAREPEAHAQALEEYLAETGADLAEAIDAIEQFRSRPEGAPAPRPASPLEWMYVGFGVPWYAVLATAYVLTYSKSGNAVLAALGFFVFLPALFAGFCGICGEAISVESRITLARDWAQCKATRTHAFAIGAFAGVLSIGGILAGVVALYPLRTMEASLWLGILWIGAVLVAAPFLGLWLLRKRAARA